MSQSRKQSENITNSKLPNIHTGGLEKEDSTKNAERKMTIRKTSLPKENILEPQQFEKVPTLDKISEIEKIADDDLNVPDSSRPIVSQ